MIPAIYDTLFYMSTKLDQRKHFKLILRREVWNGLNKQMLEYLVLASVC